ncbi:MAG: NADH:flavin oxidoreductase [Oceanicaulis sp.]
MWKPPEKIRYTPDPGPWPSAEEAAVSALFRPLQHGALKLETRTWVPAMVPWRASEDGEVTEDVIAWYERFARGRPGAIVAEATGVRDTPSGPLLRIGHDRFIPGLERLTKAVRKASGGETRFFIQLIDFLTIRRRPDPAKYFERYLAVTPEHRDRLGLRDAREADVRAALAALDADTLAGVLTARELESLTHGYRERVTDTCLSHIADLPARLPGLFADAAERAVKARFDGVELHYAHAYTMASFLSQLNTRTDGYGGSRENRARLALEVIEAVRGRVGADAVVGARFLSEDCVEGGLTNEDACAFGVDFAGAGLDFLSLSRGGKFEDAGQPKVGWAAYPYTGPSGYECMPQFLSDAFGPFGRNFEPTRRVREAVRAAGFETPVVAAGGVHGFKQAEAVITGGVGDIVGAARQSLADPDWFLKARTGRGGEARVCEFTNYCEGLDQKHKQVTCKLWDREALDADDARLSHDAKRRLEAPGWE